MIVLLFSPVRLLFWRYSIFQFLVSLDSIIISQINLFLSPFISCMIQYPYLIMFVYWVYLCACEYPFSFHSLDSSLSLYVQVIGVEYPARSADVLYDFDMILQSILHVTHNLFSYHQSWHTFAMTIYCSVASCCSHECHE